MRKVLLAGFAAAALYGTPCSAQAPGVPSYNWTGFYLGAEGGTVLGRTQQTFVDLIGVENDITAKSGIDGALAGGTAGFNWQFAPNWVIGIEGDHSWTNAKIKSPELNPLSSTAITDTLSQSRIETLRGRFGFAWGPTLLYVTGGYIWSKVKVINDSSFFGGPLTLGVHTYRDTTFGGGIEQALGGGWSAKAEYLYANFGRRFAFQIGGFPRSVDLSENIFRVGLNYKFGSR